MILIRPTPAFFCQTVFLQTTVWFLRDRHFNKPLGQSRQEITRPKGFSVFKTKSILDFIPCHLTFKNIKHSPDLGGGLWCDLGGDRQNGIRDHPQHEFYERCGIALFRAFLKNLIILGLIFVNHAFNGDVAEKRIPSGQNKGLPKPTIRPLPSENG